MANSDNRGYPEQIVLKHADAEALLETLEEVWFDWWHDSEVLSHIDHLRAALGQQPFDASPGHRGSE